MKAISVKPMLYLDTGVLSTFMHSNTPLNDFTLVYSDAHLLDWKNADNPTPELDFLSSQNALHLSQRDDKVLASPKDANLAFQQVTDFDVAPMGKLWAMMHGGGADQNAEITMQSIIRELTGVPVSFDSQAISPYQKDRRLSIRDIDQVWARTESQVKKQYPSDDQNPINTIAHSLCGDDLREFQKAFPENLTSFSEIQIACGVLSLMGIGQSKGLRKQKPIAAEAGEHDYIDCQHIAFGLHCDAFITADVATAEKATYLSNYWNLRTVICLREKIRRPEAP
ncbi:hypothetical protein FAP39_01275 [Shimia litoralis]|uniref:Uncharacterized protein n=1 Tax=Shimia litoralis TaxID=420403 RepID=A0A4U7N9S8_9RHOB|nr:hypothetical protein FAP39_01275 [Shimia litoralis]